MNGLIAYNSHAPLARLISALVRVAVWRLTSRAPCHTVYSPVSHLKRGMHVQITLESYIYSHISITWLPERRPDHPYRWRIAIPFGSAWIRNAI